MVMVVQVDFKQLGISEWTPSVGRRFQHVRITVPRTQLGPQIRHFWPNYYLICSYQAQVCKPICHSPFFFFFFRIWDMSLFVVNLSRLVGWVFLWLVQTMRWCFHVSFVLFSALLLCFSVNNFIFMQGVIRAPCSNVSLIIFICWIAVLEIIFED